MVLNRLLARNLIYDGMVHPLTLVTPLGNGKFRLEPFVEETHSTVFEDTLLALIPADSVPPSGNSVDSIVKALQAPEYRIFDKPLKLIAITSSGCTCYKI